MKISKINEVYLELEVDEDVSRELCDYFTFEVPGAKFMPQYWTIALHKRVLFKKVN